MSTEQQNKDLTIGRPEKVLLKFCMPLFASVVFQQLYNIADSLIAGRYIGENALAAVGNSYQITLIFLAFAFGCNIGCSVIVSQFFGAKQYEDMKSAVYTTWIGSAVLCIVLMLIGFTSCGYILRLIRTPEVLIKDSTIYLMIYIGGLPFLLFYNVANGIFSALGDSKTPFSFLAISSTSNILVDILFVKYFKMGISGVAWATFICQGVSCVLSIIFVLRRLRAIKTGNSVCWFSTKIFSKIVKIAVPSILQQGFIALGNIILQGIINDYGQGVIAGYSTAVKINNLIITAFTTLGNGISNYAAQNLGARKLDRIKAGFKAGIKMVWIISAAVAMLYIIFAGDLIKIFMQQPSDLALKTGKEFLYIVSPFYFVVSAKLVADGILRGTGLMGRFMIATFTDLILRVILAMLFSGFLGTIGIWAAWPVGWSIATAMSIFFFIEAGKNNYKLSLEG